jgi:hypothetical protein
VAQSGLLTSIADRGAAGVVCMKSGFTEPEVIRAAEKERGRSGDRRAEEREFG